ncbi:extracellular solute-binding protein [Billgrantia endophytica]|nr:extracellular solute-binding protein [Halomonas endophytica]
MRPRVIGKTCIVLPLAATLLTAPLALASAPLKVHAPRLNDPEAPIFAAFTQETGIPIELVSLSMEELTSAFEAALASEAEPPVDVLMVVDTGNIHRLMEAGWLQPLESESLETRVPVELRDLEAGWSGYATRARVIYVNPDKIDWVPESYEALADERLAGKLCLGGGASAYNTSLMASVVAHHGEAAAEEWAEALVANLAQPAGGRDSELLQALAAPGDCAVTLANHYYYLRLLESENAEEQSTAEALKLVWPNQQGEGLEGRGAYRNVAAFAVAQGTPRAEQAVRFLEHTAGVAMQRDVAGGIFFPVVAEGVDEINAEQRLGHASMDTLSMRQLTGHLSKARQILARVGWE